MPLRVCADHEENYRQGKEVYASKSYLSHQNYPIETLLYLTVLLSEQPLMPPYNYYFTTSTVILFARIYKPAKGSPCINIKFIKGLCSSPSANLGL